MQPSIFIPLFQIVQIAKQLLVLTVGEGKRSDAFKTSYIQFISGLVQ